MLKSICFTSSLSKELSILETEILFDTSKRNNDKKNLKGLLYKYDSNYFQIIEGLTEDVDNLYAKIKVDKRHKNITELVNQPISQLTFNQFTTGYKLVDLDTIFGLQEYYSFMETKNLPGKEGFNHIISNLFNDEI